MSETIIPRTVAVTGPRTAGWLDRVCRKVVLRRLERLQGGRVVIADNTGTEIVGSGEPVVTVRVDDPRFYRRVVFGGSLGAADAWIRGLWSCDSLVELLRIFCRNLDVADSVEGGAARVGSAVAGAMHALRRNNRAGSRRNIVAHYDLGNDFFALMLDDTMTYSSGIFPRPDSTMREASVEKLDRVCRKLKLGPHDRVLEIGTGWGSFAIHAAGNYGCRVTTTTISRRQHELATTRIQEAGLQDRVELLLEDYRDLCGTYDRIASIEMIEAVGHRYLDGYFGACSRLLSADGLMVLQAITVPDQRWAQYRRSVDFIQRYVFPGSCLPSLGAMVGSLARATDLRVIGQEDITPHYVTTLQRWRQRFLENIAEVSRLGYPDELLRLWDFYLCYCEAGFAQRTIADVQLVLAKPGYRGEAAAM